MGRVALALQLHVKETDTGGDAVSDEQRNESGGSAPPGASGRRKLIIWATVLVLVVVIVPVAWVYLGSPAFCNICHEMKPVVAGWEEAPHAQEDWASCLDCHADPGLWGEFKAHVGGALYVYKHFTERPDATDLVAHVESEWCVNCHEEAWDDPAFTTEHPTKESVCAVCHRETAHTNENPHYPVAEEKAGEDS